MKPIAFLICCLFSLSAWSQQDLNSALKLSNSEQYEEAEKVFEGLVKTNATNGDVYYYYGETLIKDYLSDTFSNSLDEYARKAETLFQTGIKQAPGNVLNLVGMGAVTLLMTSDTTKANPYFEQAELAVPLKLKKKDFLPQHAVILTKLAAAQMYGRVHRFKKAYDYLNRAKVINPADPNIFLTMGDVYIKQNDATSALYNYNQALIKDPTSPIPKIMIGNIYMRVPNINAARPYFEEALQIDSLYAPVYRSLGELWTMAGRYDLAKQYYYKFVIRSGNTTPAKVRYGNSLFRAKDYAGALSVIEEVLKVDDSRNYLNRLAAYSCYDKKPQELEKGLNYIETFFKNTDPENIITRDYLYYGRILYRLAKNDSVMLDRAFTQLKKAYAMDETDKALLSEIAMNYYYSRRYTDAIETFQLKAAKGQADKNDPMLIGKAYYSLAMASRSPQDIDNADAAFSKIVADDPGNIEAHLYLARSVSLRDPESKQGLAAPKFEALIALVGSETEKYKQVLNEAFSYMGYYNLQKKDYEASRSWYDKLLNLDAKNKEWQIRALQSMALTCYREKNYVAARDYYQRILVVDPNDAVSKKAVNDLTTVINAAKKP